MSPVTKFPFRGPAVAFGVLAALGAAANASEASGRTKPELRTAAGHVMKYWVSRPAGWEKGKTYPVVVVIPDATRDFEGNLAAFEKAGAATPFLFVAPHVVTSGGNRGYREAPSYRYSAADWNEVDRLGDFDFDATGIAAAVADVRRLDGGEERYFLTGWEAGGHTVWALLFQHPEAMRAVAPVSPNYRGRWITEAEFSKSPARATLPVKILFCGKLSGQEEAGRQFWFTQSREAVRVAESHGFKKVPFEELEGRPHGPLAADVLAFFSGVLESPAAR